MANISQNAQNLLKYLNIYDLTPTVFADELSGAYPGSWTTETWFTYNLNYGVQEYPRAPHGLFRTSLAELLNNGY